MITINPNSIKWFKINGDFAIKNGPYGVELIPLSTCFIDNNTKPFYKHDCDDCVFLGSEYIADSAFDAYFCPNENTVIARYGIDEQYVSGISFKDVDPRINFAFKLAKEGRYL